MIKVQMDFVLIEVFLYLDVKDWIETVERLKLRSVHFVELAAAYYHVEIGA